MSPGGVECPILREVKAHRRRGPIEQPVCGAFGDVAGLGPVLSGIEGALQIPAVADQDYVSNAYVRTALFQILGGNRLPWAYVGNVHQRGRASQALDRQLVDGGSACDHMERSIHMSEGVYVAVKLADAEGLARPEVPHPLHVGGPPPMRAHGRGQID